MGGGLSVSAGARAGEVTLVPVMGAEVASVVRACCLSFDQSAESKYLPDHGSEGRVQSE